MEENTENILDLKERTKYGLRSDLYFVIDDYDIKLFKDNIRLIDINTYPNKPTAIIGKYFNFSK